MTNNPISILRAAMKRKKMSAQDLAEAARVSPSLISRYLSGECEIGALNAHRLAPVLGVKFDDILGRKYAA